MTATGYGRLELAYAKPIAEAIVVNAGFRTWLLDRTIINEDAPVSKPLAEEMRSRRGKGATTWWRSHYTEKCRCPGCSGQETDLLVIFEGRAERRFALHIEVKQPTDHFPKDRDQAGNYSIRAACWIKTPPPAIIPHTDAATMLICSETCLDDFATQAGKFDSIVTFEAMQSSFPLLTVPRDQYEP